MVMSHDHDYNQEKTMTMTTTTTKTMTIIAKDDKKFMLLTFSQICLRLRLPVASHCWNILLFSAVPNQTIKLLRREVVHLQVLSKSWHLSQLIALIVAHHAPLCSAAGMSLFKIVLEVEFFLYFLFVLIVYLALLLLLLPVCPFFIK